MTQKMNEDAYYKQLENNYYHSLEPQPKADLDKYDEDLEGVNND